MPPTRPTRRLHRLPIVLTLVSLAPLAFAQTPSDPKRAAEAYLAGARLFDHKDLAGAQAEFTRATQLDPAHHEYALALDLVRQNRIGQLLAQSAAARLEHQPEQADSLIAQATSVNPADERILEHQAAEQQAATAQHPLFTPAPQRTYAPAIRLAPTEKPQAFDVRGDVKTIVTSVAGGYGIKVTYDDSVTAQQLRFVLEEQPYQKSMAVLLHMAHLFATPLDAHSILVAKDTQENHDRLDRQLEESIYVPAATPEQLNELTNIIKNVFDVKQVVIQPGSGTIVLRAPEETIKAVNFTVSDLVDGGAQVVLELRLYSVDRSITRTLGSQLPNSAGVFSVAQEAQSIVNANQTAVQALISAGLFIPTANALQNTIIEALLLIASGAVANPGLVAIFGHGLTLFGITQVGGAGLSFGLNSSEVQALDDLSVRVGDHQTTTLRIGERYPITTSTYSSGLSSTTTSALAGATINGVSVSSLLNQFAGAAATIPVIAYEDLGITLKTTPSVLKSGLVAVHVDLKLEALQGTALNNIPVLTSSVFTSDITLNNGDTAVLLSNLTSNESASVSGIPGLGELPGFAETIGGTHTGEHDHSELVLLVTPHIIRRRSDTLATKPYVFHTSVPQEF